MRRPLLQRHAWLVTGMMFAGGCIVYDPPLRQAIQPHTTTVPVQAFLRDGSIVRYDQGIVLRGEALIGSGIRYDAALNRGENRVDSLPLDSVMTLENVKIQVNVPASVGVSVLAGTGFAVAIGAIIVGLEGLDFGWSTGGGGAP